jgi:NitT/TauT family transport system substrate-binding protein
MLMSRLTRRSVVAGALAVPGIAALGSGAFAQLKPEKTKVVLAVGGKSALYYLPLTIAERLGYFKEAGIDVEINDFQGGAKSLQALMGGSADVVAGAYEHTMRMQLRGQAIVGFVLMGRGMQIAIAVRSDKAAAIKSPADAKGLKFGVSAPGSSTHLLVNYWIGKGGLKPSDVVVIGVGAGASVVAGIEKGELDAISQTDPAVSILEQKGAVKVLVDTRTLQGNIDLFGGPMPAACLYGQPDLVKKTPGTAQALARGIVRANQWLQKASPEEVAKTVPESYLLGDRALYMGAFSRLREVYSPDGMMPAGAQETALRFLAAGDAEVKPEKVTLADTWTNEFAQRAGS